MSDVTEPIGSALPNRATRRASARRTRRIGAALTATSAVMSGAAVLGTTTPAGALTTWTVNNTTDLFDGSCDVDCSLRDAVYEANNDADDSEIVFAANVTGTIQLTGGVVSELELYGDGNLAITGPGAAALTVRGTDADNVFYADETFGGYTLVMSGLTVTNGRAPRGAGIEFYASDAGDDPNLTLVNMVITGNDATSYGSGGGGVSFYEGDTLTIINSTISGNTSQSMGGGVFFYNSENMIVTNSVISGNTSVDEGGGIGLYYDNGDDKGNLTITGSTISGNHTDDDGGGVAFYAGDTLIITNSTISGNTAGENGGGLYFYGYTGIISNSTFANNEATGNGGGISVFGQDITLQQTTISGNTAGAFGDGLYLNGSDLAAPLKADNPKVEEVITKEDPDKAPKTKTPSVKANDGVGALDVEEVILIGTIVSGNGTADIETGTGEEVTVSSTNSLIGTTGLGITLTDVGGTIRSTAPGLAALANNGGPTQTMKLLTGSLALDSGPTTVPTFSGNGFDQRGDGYPRVINGRVDIGAYEAELVGLFTG